MKKMTLKIMVIVLVMSTVSMHASLGQLVRNGVVGTMQIMKNDMHNILHAVGTNPRWTTCALFASCFALGAAASFQKDLNVLYTQERNLATLLRRRGEHYEQQLILHREIEVQIARIKREQRLAFWYVGCGTTLFALAGSSISALARWANSKI